MWVDIRTPWRACEHTERWTPDPPSDRVGPGKGLSMRIYNNLPGDADAAEAGAAPWELLVWRNKLDVAPLTPGSLLRTYATRRKQEEGCDCGQYKLPVNIPQTVGQRASVKADFTNVFQRER